MRICRRRFTCAVPAIGLVVACSRGSIRSDAPRSAETPAETSAARQAATGTHHYATRFPGTENPISEGGHWINGGSVGLDWTNVSTIPGLAIGHQVGASFTDATALLTGAWGPDQRVAATVYATGERDACSQEVELRLRSEISAHRNAGYEIGYHVAQGPAAYMIIVRWNGALGDYTYLLKESGARYGIGNGDVVSASIAGSVITAYRNGKEMGRATDSTFRRGVPGMGFNLESAPAGCAGTNGDYGFTSYTATDRAGP